MDRLNNLSKGLEETEQELGVAVPERGRSKQRRMERSMVVRSLDSFVVRVMSTAKRENVGLVGTEDESSKKRAKLE